MATQEVEIDQVKFGLIKDEITANLPSSWISSTLGESFKWGSGGTPRSGVQEYYAGGNIPWLIIGDLNDGVVNSSQTSITDQGLKDSSAKLVEPGTILVAMYGSIGKLGIAGKALATNQAIAFAYKNEIDPMYLFYFLMRIRGRLISLGKGATQLNISQTVIKAFPFVIAPLAEQHRIVAKIEELFSELDKGNECLKTAREQLTLYRQALLKSAFDGALTEGWRRNYKSAIGGVEDLKNQILCERRDKFSKALTKWEATCKRGLKPKPPKLISVDTSKELALLPKLPHGWSWEKIGNLAHVGTGVTPLKGRVDFYEGGKIPWVTSGALNNNFVKEASDYLTTTALRETGLKIYPKNTLLVAMYGEGKTRGKCSELLIDATINQAIAAIVFEGTAGLLRKYIKLFFQKNYSQMRLKSSGGVQPNLNLGIVENTYIPLCPSKEADAIVGEVDAILSRIDEFEGVVDASVLQIDSLRQSILQKAFSGQLVPQDPNDEPASELLARIKAEVAKSKPIKKKKAA